jgi:LPS-assembly protein
MTSDLARPISGPALVWVLAVLACLLLPVPLSAEDTNGDGCAANENDAGKACEADGESPVIEAHPLDWVPLEHVPEALRDRQCINCGGRYIDPLEGVDAGGDPEEAQIDAITNRSEIRGNEVRLSGGVEAVQGYRRLRADEAQIDREERSALLTGNVSLREPGILLRGEQAEVYYNTGEVNVENSEFVFHERHMRGSADLLDRDDEGLLHVHDGMFTYCQPSANDWSIEAENMELDLEEGLGVARDAKLRVSGVPIFYTPWLQFPLDDRRRTGFLWPDIGNDSSGGVDIAAPVYFNLAPNYDAIYAPRYIQERGLLHELQGRFLHPLVGLWTIGGAYMDDDDRYSDQVPDDQSTDRWLYFVKQNGLFQKRWRSRIDYSKASDVDYLKDLETSSLDSQRRTALPQRGALDYLGDRWLVNLEVQQFQSLADDINEDYQKKPQITGRYRSDGTPFQIEPILLAQYSDFDSDEDRVTGQRLYAEAGAAYPMLWSYGFFKPTLKYRQLSYDLSESRFFEDDSPSTGAGMASLDGGLVFERDTSVRGKSLLQTLEPRVYYLYSEYEEQTDQPDFDSAELTFTYGQLFRETRFSGRDRIDDANQVSLGLTTQYIDPASGRSLFSASLGQIYYLRDRKVRLLPFDEPLDDSSSEIAGDLNFNPGGAVSFRTSLVYDPHTERMNSGHVLASYAPNDISVFNLGYSFRRPLTTVVDQPVTEEAHASAYFPLDNNWRFFAAINYSVEANTSVEDMAGLEYDTCCWKIRLLHLRYYENISGRVPDFDNPNLEREHSTQVQIVLKGMGGFGNRITGIMEDMIRGFEDSDY